MTIFEQKISLRYPRFLLIILLLSLLRTASAQSDVSHMLFGDFHVDESQSEKNSPQTFDLFLYSETGSLIARQRIYPNGRYRFQNIHNGRYDLVVELENKEVARVRIDVMSAFKTDIQQDISLAWSSRQIKDSKAQTISVADIYPRSGAAKHDFEKAESAIDKQNYEEAIKLLMQVLEKDPKDFQSWTEIGTAYLGQNKYDEAEQAYLRSISERPTYVPALLNLGRVCLLQKNYPGAVENLESALKIQPQSANVNYYLGEAYLQSKKGSKAVGYFYEALKIDPLGKAEAHLRLATLYNAAGYKDKAAEEYAQFLAKRPDYPEKKKLQQYITENKKH